LNGCSSEPVDPALRPDSICIVYGHINNTTPDTLTLSSADLEYGVWVTSPPEAIYPGEIGSFEADSQWLDFVGVQGTLDYLLPGTPGSIIINFFNPYVGYDKFDISCPAGIDCQWSSQSGYKATVNYLVATLNSTFV